MTTTFVRRCFGSALAAGMMAAGGPVHGAVQSDLLCAYAPSTAAAWGGEANAQVNMANGVMGSNALNDQTGTGAGLRIVGYFMSSRDSSGEDNAYVLGLVAGDASYSDVRNYAASVGADQVVYVPYNSQNSAGNAYQPGTYSAISSTWWWLVLVAHETGGHNYGAAHGDDHLNPKGIMMHNYCGGGASWPYFYSSPNIWQNGVQLVGDGYTCLGGGLINGGDNGWRISTAAQGMADTTARVVVGPNLTNAVLRWCFTNAPGAVAAGATNFDLIAGAPAVVNGTGATNTGKALRLPGGASGSGAAYLQLPGGIISSRTNVTIEIWATPLSAQNWGRILDFNNGTANYIMLSSSIGTDLNSQRFESANGGTYVTVNSGLPTVAGVAHHYAITFTDGAGSYGSGGGRWQWYRDAEPIGFLDVNYHLSSLQDGNNWLGRSAWAADALANCDYAEVRISNVALSRLQLLANYRLGPNYFDNSTVRLTDNDSDWAVGVCSFTSAGKWSNGSAPTAGNRYETFDFRMWAPRDGVSHTFAGDSLRISGGELLWNNWVSSTITINDFCLNGGSVLNRSYEGQTLTLAGNLSLTNDNTCNGINGGIILSANLKGDGSITFLNNTATLTGNNTAFRGKTLVGCGVPGGLSIDSEARLGANPTSFTADQLKLNRGWLYTTATMAISNSNRGIQIGPSGGIFNVAPGTTLTLAAPVSSAPTPASSIIAGLLIKDNSGTLTLTSPSNTFNGPVEINAGTFAVANGGRFGGAPFWVHDGTALVDNNGTIDIGGWWASIGQRGNDAGTMTLRGNGVFKTTGDFNFGDLGASSGTLNLLDNATATCGAFFAGSANESASSARGVVNQSGGTLRAGLSGDLNLAFCLGGRNSATTLGIGAYNLNGGTVSIDGYSFIGGYGRGTLTVNGGSLISDSWISIGRFASATGNLVITSGSVAQTNRNAREVIVGEDGVGTLTISGGSLNVQASSGLMLGKNATGKGTVNLDGGTILTTNVNRGNVSAAGTFNFNGGALKAIGNNPTFLTGLTAANIKPGGAVIDDAGFAITIGQALLNAGGGLTKLGNGSLNLTGANTYTGQTTVSQGTLWVNGSVAGPISLTGGATLGGTGIVKGPVSVAAGGTLSPGNSIGTLVISNSLSLSGTTFIELNQAAGTFDRVTGLSNVAFGGTLTVVNLAGTFVGGESYPLFSAGSYTGNFAAMNLPALPGGLSWRFDAGSGVLSVLTAFQSWQMQYFGGTNCPACGPDADFDGDGFSNTNEFLAGFNPTNSAAYLRILNVQAVGDDVVVTYLGAAGDSNGSPGPKTNVLEVAAGAAAGSYTNNFASTGQTNILSGGTGLGLITNMVEAGGATNSPSRFYRVRVLTP